MMRQRSCSFVNLHCDVIEIDKAEQINNAQVGCDGSVEYRHAFEEQQEEVLSIIFCFTHRHTRCLDVDFLESI